MEKGLTIYNKVFEGCNVDMLVKNDGDILFEIYSVGVAVGYSKENGSDCVQSGHKLYPRKERIDDTIVKADIKPIEIEGKFYMTEGDLYDFIFEAGTAKCKPFKKWVTHEVLPSIRKKGCYSIAPVQDKRASLLMSIIDAPDDVTRALAVKNYTDCVTAPLKEQLAEQAPKVEYCDAVLNSYSGVTTTVIAQDYGMSAQKFNKLLNKMHIQYKQGNTWVLYREHKGKGYTESETIVKNGYSVVSTRWTQKGRQFIYETLKDAGILPVKELNEVKENNEAV